ncbi:MAG: metal-dependent hydrolase [Candidatus Syntropharchaeales archaeon]
MIYLTHILFGLMLYLGLLVLGLPVSPSPVDYALLMLGAVIPDIDTRRSFISNRNILTKSGSSILRLFTSHRGFLHTVPAALLSTLLLGVLIWYTLNRLDLALLFAFTLGYLSHIIADSIKSIPTGSERERAFFYFSLLTVAMLFMAYYSRVI